jgi:septal ring factor EnvC (AmiA/AmiB activator)
LLFDEQGVRHVGWEIAGEGGDALWLQAGDRLSIGEVELEFVRIAAETDASPWQSPPSPSDVIDTDPRIEAWQSHGVQAPHVAGFSHADWDVPVRLGSRARRPASSAERSSGGGESQASALRTARSRCRWLIGTIRKARREIADLTERLESLRVELEEGSERAGSEIEAVKQQALAESSLQLEDLQAELWSVREQLQASQAELHASHDRGSELAALQGELATSLSENERLAEEIARLQYQLEEQGDFEVLAKQYADQLQASAVDCSDLRDQLQAAHADLEQLRSGSQEWEARISELQEAVGAQESAAAEAQQRWQSLQQEHQSLIDLTATQREQWHQQLDEARHQTDELQRQNASLQEQLAGDSSQRHEADQELLSLQERLQQQEAQVAALAEQLESAQDQLGQRATEVEVLGAQNQEQSEQLAELNADLDGVRAELVEREASADAYQQQIQQQETRIAELEELLDTVKSELVQRGADVEAAQTLQEQVDDLTRELAQARAQLADQATQFEQQLEAARQSAIEPQMPDGDGPVQDPAALEDPWTAVASGPAASHPTVVREVVREEVPPPHNSADWAAAMGPSEPSELASPSLDEATSDETNEQAARDEIDEQAASDETDEQAASDETDEQAAAQPWEPIASETADEANFQSADLSAEADAQVAEEAAVEAIPAASHSPESFIEKYRHLLDDDAGGSLEAPQRAASPTLHLGDEYAPQVAVPASGPRDTEDDALEAYMSNLMNRVRGDSRQPSGPAESARAVAAAAAATAAASAEASAAETAAAGPQEPIDLDTLRNSTRKTELPTDIGKLRDLANTSARKAIAKHRTKHHREALLSRLLACLIALGVAGYLVSQADSIYGVQFAGGLAIGAIGLLAGAQMVPLLTRMRHEQRPTNARPTLSGGPTDAEAEAAGEERFA